VEALLAVVVAIAVMRELVKEMGVDVPSKAPTPPAEMVQVPSIPAVLVPATTMVSPATY
jgi:hypothetical protein